MISPKTAEVRATTDAAEAFRTADFIVHAVPLQATRKALEAVKHRQRPEPTLLPCPDLCVCDRVLASNSVCLQGTLCHLHLFRFLPMLAYLSMDCGR